MKAKKCNKEEDMKMETKKKIDVRVKRTYKQLIESLLKLLNDKSFDEISISEICENADVHRATFYKHFDDKTEFLNFCVKQLLAEVDFSHVLSYPSPENVKESCMSFVKVLFNFIDTNRVLFAAVFSDRHSLSFDTTLINVITDFCALKLKQVLEGVPDYKAQIFSNFYAGSVIGVVKWYVKNYEVCPLEDVYAFFERRIDEICDAYIKYYLDDLRDKLI